MRKALPIAVLAVLAVAAGCDSSKQAPPEAALVRPAVPFVASTPAQLAQTHTAAPPCRGVDLRIPNRSVTFSPTRKGGGSAVITITNAGSRPCRLTGRPRVRLVTNGGPQQKQVPIAPHLPTFPEVAYPTYMLLALGPGKSAGLTVTWDNWCDPALPGKPHVPPSAIRVTLPDGRGSLSANYNAVPSCSKPSAPSTIGVSVFQPAQVTSAQAFTTGLLQASIPGQPLEAWRGGVLRYRVVLRNVSRSPIRFDDCPAYAQQLAPVGKTVVYDLNCKDARPIQPRKSIVFAIEIRVPQKAPLGANGLFWQLDPFGAQQPQVSARVLVNA